MDADAFYGTTAAAPEAPPTPGTLTTGGLAEPSTAKAEAEPPKDAQEALYGDPEAVASRYLPTMGDALQRVADDVQLSDTDRAAAQAETVAIFNDLGMSADEASSMYALYAHAIREPADSEQIQAWGTEAMDAARMRYGADLDSRLRAAREYVAARPGLKQALHVSGLGSHPRVVAEMLERAYSLKGRSKR